MSMDKKDKDEMVVLITDALNDVMIPALENMEERLRNDLASKDDLKEVKVELISHIDSLERKFDAQQNRLDRHGKDIKFLKSHFVTI